MLSDVLKCISAFPCKGKWSEIDREVQLPLVKKIPQFTVHHYKFSAK